MKKRAFGLSLLVSFAWAFPVLLVSTVPLSRAQQERTAVSPAENSLKGFLRTYLGTLRSSEDRTTRYVDVFVDLDGGGAQEAIVYVTGQEWCGSGGCVLLVLSRSGSSYKVVAKTTVVWPPISVLTGSSNGWHNIGVWVRGGGVRPGYEAELRFDGRTYPTNPSVPPARRLSEGIEGKVVIPSVDSSKALYP